jgi:hypothetical protein
MSGLSEQVMGDIKRMTYSPSGMQLAAYASPNSLAAATWEAATAGLQGAKHTINIVRKETPSLGNGQSAALHN